MKLAEYAELVERLEGGRLAGRYRDLILAAEVVAYQLESTLWLDRLAAEAANLAERARAVRELYAELLETRYTEGECRA